MGTRSLGNGINGGLNEARVVANTILDKLDAIAERTEDLYVRENYTYVQRVLTVPAGDTAAQDVISIPQGVIWRIRRFAVTGAVNGAFAAYLDDVQPQNLVDGEFTNAAIAAWAPGGDGIYVPAGRNLYLRFYAQPAGQVCTVNMRVTELKVEE